MEMMVTLVTDERKCENGKPPNKRQNVWLAQSCRLRGRRKKKKVCCVFWWCLALGTAKSWRMEKFPTDWLYFEKCWNLGFENWNWLKMFEIFWNDYWRSISIRMTIALFAARGDEMEVMQLLHARGARPDLRAQNVAGTADWGYLRYRSSCAETWVTSLVTGQSAAMCRESMAWHLGSSLFNASVAAFGSFRTWRRSNAQPKIGHFRSTRIRRTDKPAVSFWVPTRWKRSRMQRQHLIA